MLTKIKTSSLRHFEAYEYLVQIYAQQLSTYNETKLHTWSIYPPKKLNFTDWPTVVYLGHGHMRVSGRDWRTHLCAVFGPGKIQFLRFFHKNLYLGRFWCPLTLYKKKNCRALEDIKNYLNINFNEKILKIVFFLAKKRRTSGFVSLARTPSYGIPFSLGC